MSTENNNLYQNSVEILSDLISFKTISGEDNNSLINYCDDILKKSGATSFKVYDDNHKNLFKSYWSKNLNKTLKQVDYIVLSPGISLNKNKCGSGHRKLRVFVVKNPHCINT